MTRRRKPAEETLRQRAAASAADRYQAVLDEVATDLGIEPDSDLCEHVASLRLMRKAILARLLHSEMLRTDPDDLMKIDAALKQYQPARKGLQVSVKFVEGSETECPECQHKFNPHTKAPVASKPIRFRCVNPKCGQWQEINPKGQFADGPPGIEVKQPEPEQPEPEKRFEELTVAGYRGLSGSAIHDSILSNGEIAPLKKLQPSYNAVRSDVSPMSADRSNPAPRREYAPGGSAFDDFNPNRKVN